MSLAALPPAPSLCSTASSEIVLAWHSLETVWQGFLILSQKDGSRQHSAAAIPVPPSSAIDLPTESQPAPPGSGPVADPTIAVLAETPGSLSALAANPPASILNGCRLVGTATSDRGHRCFRESPSLQE
ncbi:MAG: hypothetical protein JRE18_09680 [Deltaproteobacteria bacterium]|nr:hypothetical protein [Deltaproteobacteria bacterium]